MAFTRHVKFEDSSTIGAVSYDFESKTLRIYFATTKSVWDYHNVYPTDFAKLASAYSPGEVFNARFRNKFGCEKVSTNKPKIETEVEKKCSGWHYPNCCADHRETYYNTAG